MNYLIKNISINEFDQAIALAERVFMEFEAPEYTGEGIECFLNFIHSYEFKRYIFEEENLFLGCFYEEALIGIVAMRNPTHISLAFVLKEFHRKRIATNMFKKLFEDRKKHGTEFITLNSSPFAVPFYHSIGFIDTGVEQTQNGIKFTPMIFYIQ